MRLPRPSAYQFTSPSSAIQDDGNVAALLIFLKVKKNLFFSSDFSSASTIVALAQRADRGTEISCRSLSLKQYNHNDHDDDNYHSTSYDHHDDHDSYSSASHPALSAPLVAHATLDVLCKMPTQHCFVMLTMIMTMMIVMIMMIMMTTI